jgi:hypothetical protein
MTKDNELNLNNLGVFISEIPNDLLNKIKTECLNLSKKEKMISSLTSKKVADHYHLENSNKELFSFLSIWVKKYIKKYNYLKYYKILNNNSEIAFKKPWFNIQKKGEFIPNHTHDGILSYSIWIQLPFLKKDDEKRKFESCFEFQYQNILGATNNHLIQLDKSYEGKFVLFPSMLQHCVYPFFNNNETRISVSGNICFNN